MEENVCPRKYIEEYELIVDEGRCLIAQDDREEFPVDVTRYGTATRAVNVMAYVLRYMKNLYLSSKKRRQEKVVGLLTASEIELAEKKWIAIVQRESFDNDFKDKKHPLRALDPWLDLESNVLRVGGRLAKIEDDYRMKHPMILPSKHHFTNLWIRREHRRLMHAGAIQTLAHCREEVWIVHGLQEVKKELRKCVTCNFWNSRACKQKMGELPLFRITQAYPFEHCGTDFTGALIPKEGGKLYVVIFTCAVTRAVHFELVSDMTTDEFIEAFKVFISRRGIPRVCYSDNAPMYKAAKKIVEKHWCDIISGLLAFGQSRRNITRM